MRTPREKFLASLLKTIKTSTSATERTAATKLYAEMTFGLKADGTLTTPTTDGSIPLPELSVPMARLPSEFDETLAFAMREHPDDGLGCLLDVLRVPRWWVGLWSQRSDGWYDSRTNTDLTFDFACKLVDLRIKELGLSPELVYAFPKSRGIASQVFWNLPFEERLNRFRSQESI